jgi:hypothetical protein
VPGKRNSRLFRTHCRSLPFGRDDKGRGVAQVDVAVDGEKSRSFQYASLGRKNMLSTASFGWCRGWIVHPRRLLGERFERAGGRIADPSLSVGMTRGEEWPKLMLLVDGRRADPSSTLRSLRFHFVWSEGHESSVRDDSSVVPIRNRTAISTGVEGSGCFCRLT